MQALVDPKFSHLTNNSFDTIEGALKRKSLRNTNARATARGAHVMQNNIAGQ